VLYLLIFGHVLEGRAGLPGVGYTAFLVPGLVMMSVLQNAFANSSSSLIQSKITGNLVFLLLTPLSPGLVRRLRGRPLRGLVVGWACSWSPWFAPPQAAAAGWIWPLPCWAR
jgi:ABC-2 type transport system permease protein